MLSCTKTLHDTTITVKNKFREKGRMQYYAVLLKASQAKVLVALIEIFPLH